MRVGWILTAAAATAVAATATTPPSTVRAAASTTGAAAAAAFTTVTTAPARRCLISCCLAPSTRRRSNPFTFVNNKRHRRPSLLLAMASASTSSAAAAAAAETLQVKRLSQDAVLPVRGSEWAAGYDLASAEETVIPAGGKGLVKTALSIAIPRDTYARIAPRSGLALKKHIDVGAGVIDYDYRGPVGVVLFNHGQEDFPVKKGDRVAQMILERICMAPVVEVETLPETARGAGGFGSTGVSEAVSENGNKRLKQEAAMEVDGAAAKPGEKGAQLLVMLNEVAKAAPAEEAMLKSLKPLALAEDARLFAALGAYTANKDAADLLDTLKLLAPSEQ